MQAILAESQVDAYPTGVNNSFVRFHLRGFAGFVPQASGSLITVTATLNSGSISQQLVPNNIITPSTTFYTCEQWSNGRITSSANYIFTANVDLSNAVPIPGNIT